MNYYLAIDTEHGGFHSDSTLLETYFGVFDQSWNQVDELHLFTKPDDGVYSVNGEAMGVNKIDIAKHDKEAQFYKDVKTPLYLFLSKWSENGAFSGRPP